MANNLDVTAITPWVDENSYSLIAKSILETDLGSIVTTKVGLKGDVVKIPLLGGTFEAQNGADCGFTPSGDVEITQVTMEIANKKFNQAYCPQVLKNTFLSQYMAAGAMNGNESLSFESIVADYFVKELGLWNEKFMINGDAGILGYKGILAAGTPATQGGVPAAWTIQNAVSQSMDLVAAIPAESANASDLVMVVSPQSLSTLRLAIAKDNLYHFAPEENVIVPGSTVRVVASAGLVGSDYKFVGPASALLMGTDLLSDSETFALRYSADSDELRAFMRWTIGVAITETSLFAENGLA